MIPYLLIIIFNYEAAVLEFHSRSQCLEAQKEIVSNLKDTRNVASSCLKKLGGLDKEI